MSYQLIRVMEWSFRVVSNLKRRELSLPLANQNQNNENKSAVGNIRGMYHR